MVSPVWQSTAASPGPGAGTNATFTLPGSIQKDDIIIVTIYKENTNAITPAAGFVEKPSVGPSTTAPQKHYTFWKRMSGGETGTIVFSWTGSTYSEGSLHRISGCITTGDPIEDTPATASSNSSVTTLNISLAGSQADSLLLWIGTNFTAGGSWTPPSGFTERSDNNTISVATKDNSAGGATGTITGTYTVGGATTAVLMNLIGAPNPGSFFMFF